MIQHTTISYDAPREINIDDVFYCIISKEISSFYEPCKVCNDTHELTVNGVTFPCPCCHQQSIRLHAYQYIVKRLRVYSIKEYKRWDDWITHSTPYIEVEMYNKTGRGYGYDGSNRFSITYDWSSLSHINDIEFFNKNDEKHISTIRNEYRTNDLLFDDYYLAVDFCNKLNQAESDRIAQHNKEFGTNYSIEWKFENDPKSK